MPLSISCPGCGKTLTIKDELMGKRIKCPQCATSFSAAEAAAKVRNEQSNQRVGVGIHVSPKVIAFVCILILIPATLAVWRLGPAKVIAEWNGMKPHATEDVSDVIDRALQSEISRSGRFNPMLAHQAPHTLQLTFLFSPMPWSMPEIVGFAGLTTEGAMHGRYHPHTGEIEATVEIGGRAVTGVLMRHGDRTIDVTGQVKDGTVNATVDGQPADVKWPTPGKRYL